MPCASPGIYWSHPQTHVTHQHIRKSALQNTAVTGCLSVLIRPVMCPMNTAASPRDCTAGSRCGKRTEQTGLFPLWPLRLVCLHCCPGSKLGKEGYVSGHVDSMCLGNLADKILFLGLLLKVNPFLTVSASFSSYSDPLAIQD